MWQLARRVVRVAAWGVKMGPLESFMVFAFFFHAGPLSELRA